MRHRSWKNRLAFVMVYIIVCLFLPPKTAHANEAVDIDVEVTYHQTEARRMLDMINGLRGTEDAWIWNSDNSEKEYFDVGPIQWDYALEQIAMQRAAEAAYYFSHTRPNGKSCSSYEYNGIHLWAENLGWGYKTTESMFDGWCEWSEDYSGQGHRRQLLGRAYVGIAHVVVDGNYIWAAAFSNSSGGTTSEFPAFDGKMKKTISVDVDFVGENHRYFRINGAGDYARGIEVLLSETVALPKTSFCLCDRFDRLKEYLGEDYTNYFILPEDKYSVAWSIDDDSIAEIRDGKIVGKKPGETLLRAKMFYLGEEYESSCTLRVTDYDLGKTIVHVEVQIILTETTSEMIVIDSSYPDCVIHPIPDYVYTGKPITILLCVSGNGNILFEGKDYEVVYQDNVGPGTATVFIKGIGKYHGQREYTFRIVKPASTPTPTPKQTFTPAPTRAATPTNKPTPIVTVSPSPALTITPTEIPENHPSPTDLPDITEPVTPDITEEPTLEPTPTEEVSITPAPTLTLPPLPTLEKTATPTSESKELLSPAASVSPVSPTVTESDLTANETNSTSSQGWVIALIGFFIVVLIFLLIII